MSKRDDAICFQTGKLAKEEVHAIKQCYAGNATPHEQRLALAVICNKLARAHDISFVPGAADESNFLAGRAFVGARVLKIINVPVGQLVEGDNDDD